MDTLWIQINLRSFINQMDASSWFMTPFWFKCRFFCNVVWLWRWYIYTVDISIFMVLYCFKHCSNIGMWISEFIIIYIIINKFEIVFWYHISGYQTTFGWWFKKCFPQERLINSIWLLSVPRRAEGERGRRQLGSTTWCNILPTSPGHKPPSARGGNEILQ